MGEWLNYRSLRLLWDGVSLTLVDGVTCFQFNYPCIMLFALNQIGLPCAMAVPSISAIVFVPLVQDIALSCS